MKDGTPSWVQPDSKYESEGMCGQTAGANLLTIYCGVNISPNEFAKDCYDPTPGTAPETLLNGLNLRKWNCASWRGVRFPPYAQDNSVKPLARLWDMIYASKWKVDFSGHPNINKTANQVVDDIDKPRKPVAVLLQLDDSITSYHWVVVTKMSRPSSKDCKVTVNNYGRQDDFSCNDFLIKWSSLNLQRTINRIEDAMFPIYRPTIVPSYKLKYVNNYVIYPEDRWA